jgi:hypothetical protein
MACCYSCPAGVAENLCHHKEAEFGRQEQVCPWKWRETRSGGGQGAEGWDAAARRADANDRGDDEEEEIQMPSDQRGP